MTSTAMSVKDEGEHAVRAGRSSGGGARSPPRRRDPTAALRARCPRCLGPHPPQRCSFINTECYVCGKKGHIAKACRRRKAHSVNACTESIGHGSENEPEVDDDEYDVPLFVVGGNADPWWRTVKVNGVNVRMQLDSAAVFASGTGQFTGKPIQLSVARDARPVLCKPRPVPHALRATVQAELRRFRPMESSPRSRLASGGRPSCQSSSSPASMASIQPSWLGPVRLRYLFLVAVIFGGSFVMMIVFHGPEFVSLDGEQLRPAHYYHLDSDTRFTIKTNGCTIPALRPVDDNIKKFIEPPRHLKPCRHMHTSLLASNATHIWINNNHRPFYNLSKDFNISCCYKAFYRPNAIPDITSFHVDDRVSYHECIEFYDVVEALDEFVRVSCYDSNIGERESLIYEDFFIFALKKPLSSVRNAQYIENQTTKAYNVIVLGIDSVSRLNFHRTMPRTLEFLKNKGAVELLGYNKIGDNTFPNVAAMLLGVKDTELKHMCWPSRKHTFDNCPFVWDWYKENGFYTAFGEDSAHLGTFNFARHGFAATPTDYYLHTFTREAEMNVGNNKDFNSFICMGNKFAFKILLNYVESLTNILQSSKLFGFFWEVTMSHDFLNNPKAMDNNYEYFLKKLEKSKYLDETVIILLSDHGLRWGNFRLTKQGRLEERLPFVHILLPPSFQHNYSLAYHNLKHNSKHLTTPYDVYATLLDLVNLDSISDEKISARNKQYYAENRSISLFLPIPRNRTCKIAGIDDHWCTCHKDRALSVDSEEAKDAAEFVVGHLNELLKQYQECARLSLDSIVGVREMEAGTPALNEEGWRELLVLVRAKPGGGVFEATLRRTVRGAVASTEAFTSDADDWALSGSVSRLNLYGNQSHCVHDYLLKLYCVCEEAKLWQKI